MPWSFVKERIDFDGSGGSLNGLGRPRASRESDTGGESVVKEKNAQIFIVFDEAQ